MKLSELDKSKLPIKVLNLVEKLYYTVKFIDTKASFLLDDQDRGWGYPNDSDYWELCEEPKLKYAMYAYKRKSGDWEVTVGLYKDDDGARYAIGGNFEVKRLMWSEVEL